MSGSADRSLKIKELFTEKISQKTNFRTVPSRLCIKLFFIFFILVIHLFKKQLPFRKFQAHFVFHAAKFSWTYIFWYKSWYTSYPITTDSGNLWPPRRAFHVGRIYYVLTLNTRGKPDACGYSLNPWADEHCVFLLSALINMSARLSAGLCTSRECSDSEPEV